jgi:ATP-dependent DNA helicase DinG
MGDVITVDEIFKKRGLLSKEIKGYRPRQGQLDLANAVVRCIEEKKHMLAEAPTGTGKSLATGIPAALESLASGRNVVYVTANITLQEQLTGKDMPLIKHMLEEAAENVEFQFALLKGMGNYLCRLNYDETRKAHAKNPPGWLKEITKWVGRTTTGDRSELQSEYADEIWRLVSTTADECLKGECPRLEDCYVRKARENIGNANVIVTNYHMWFTDMNVREATGGMFSFLPEHDIVIMDEAHQAPEIARDFRGFQLSYPKMRWMFKGLLGKGDAAERLYSVGMKATIAFFSRLQPGGEDTRILQSPLGADNNLMAHLLAAAKAYRTEAAGIESTDQSAIVRRAKLSGLATVCKEMAAKVGETCFGVHYSEDEQKYRLGAKDNLGSFRRKRVYFLEKSDDHEFAELRCKAIDPSKFFRKHVFSQKTAIMTSATLSTHGSFSFIAGQFGLQAGEYEAMEVPNPFRANKVLGVIPAGFPSPKKQPAEHVQGVVDTISNLIPKIHGGMLMLFTSHQSLRDVASGLRKLDFDKKTLLLVQREKPKSRIIQLFKEAYDNSQSAVILGTSSFWQGIDIPGQALAVVGIDKLPFPRPDDPVLWYLQESGRNDFFEYSLPKAVITLKQGVGRLIRSEKDYGTIIFFDERMQTEGYGVQFREVLPDGCFLSDDINDIPAFLESKANGVKL